jgi:hypothetical protein
MDASRMPSPDQFRAMLKRVNQATASTPGGPTLQDIIKATEAEVAAFRARQGQAEGE